MTQLEDLTHRLGLHERARGGAFAVQQKKGKSLEQIAQIYGVVAVLLLVERLSIPSQTIL